MDKKFAENTVEFISKLGLLAKTAVPEPLANEKMKRHVKRSHSQSSLQFGLDGSPSYNSITNRLSSYVVTHPEKIQNFDRTISSKAIQEFVWDVEEMYGALKASSENWLEKSRQNLDESLRKPLSFKPSEALKRFAIVKRGDQEDITVVYENGNTNMTHHTVIKTPKDILTLIHNMLLKIGVSLKVFKHLTFYKLINIGMYRNSLLK